VVGPTNFSRSKICRFPRGKLYEIRPNFPIFFQRKSKSRPSLGLAFYEHMCYIIVAAARAVLPRTSAWTGSVPLTFSCSRASAAVVSSGWIRRGGRAGRARHTRARSALPINMVMTLRAARSRTGENACDAPGSRDLRNLDRPAPNAARHQGDGIMGVHVCLLMHSSYQRHRCVRIFPVTL